LTAFGYVGGDPTKVSKTGDTMTGPLVLPGNPVQALQAAPKQYVDAGGGGGGTAFQGAWSAVVDYLPGQLVTYLGSLWGALSDNLNHAPVVTQEIHTDTPVTSDSGDAGAYEMGLIFSVNTPTRLLGVAFYKSAANVPAGTRNASLWNNDTFTLMNRRGFPSETATGRQFCPLNVDLSPGVTYNVSIGVPSGHYSLTTHAYDAPVTVGPVTVPTGGGVFNPGNVGLRPSSVSQNSDYWVWPVWEGSVDANWALAGRGSF
jgi:uncharacterized protein DUF4082